ncbi:cytochrome b/b6 domain-containing protein [Pseudomonas sp. NW5]|uniref:cytochrome b/b6 domain-containing protein n=1 Tax=Pseudomonas sp. NW5 TaxID=2934934 RepID=UPI0020212EAD|nr:cytochrome b/b6 domain-containing protein [Pseudomonas sp. NW5]MCL7461355.1 cytochrome b/b6 domain-containing protein [Pseudomonas sp. NW5]
MTTRSIRVWDLPTRLFHWLLALSVSAALLTGWLGGNWMVWHGRLGVLIAGLLAFRLAWGVLGSTYARFSGLLHLPVTLPAYLRGQWQGAGHNPLGWLSVLAMLGMLSFQVLSGLVANDDIAFTGPLQRLVDSDTSSRLTGLHRQAMWLVIGLIGLHLAALLFYRLRGERLVGAMLHGRRDDLPANTPEARGGRWPALLLALLIGAAALWGASGQWIPAPPPPPASTPAW